MKSSVVRFRSRIKHSSEKVFKWHLRPFAFQRLIPPWKQIKIISKEINPSAVSSQLVLKVKWGPLWKKWVVQREDYVEGKSFTDIQLEGPFRSWKHIHRVHPLNENACELEDEIHFQLPLPFFKSWMQKKINRMLHWRHETLINDLEVEKNYPSPPLRILVSGSRGLVGSTLIPFLRTLGHQVFRLVRNSRDVSEDAILWNPLASEDVRLEDFENFDVIVHLAGKNIASSRWNEKIKAEIFSSRCRDTALLSQLLLKLSHPPKTFICACAIGIYGNRKGEILIESSLPGNGFLANLCQKWEDATIDLEKKGIRRIHMRFGMILSLKGGALKRMLPPFQCGLGAVFGDGKQEVSWIALDDVIYALYHTLCRETISGGVNFTAPEVETNRSLSQKLAKALHRPLFLRIGEKPLKWALGEMAEEMFLSSTRAIPEKLVRSGYHFLYPSLNQAFKRLSLN